MITPKEKAKELVDRMYKVHSGTASEITLYTSKQCALIAVEEILNDYSYMQNVRNANSNQIHSQRIYWKEVKQEIEIL
jgi:hypothetical protein